MSEGEQKYMPTEGQLERRERLTSLVRQAMGYSDELVPAVMVLQEAALVSVDVTTGRATDADLKAAAEDCLQRLVDYVDVHPMRQSLRKVIDQLECELAAAEGTAYAVEGDAQANELGVTGDAPRKERAG